VAQSETDLSVSVSSDVALVPLNTNFTLSIQVENLGVGEASFVSVTSQLPSEVVFLTSSDCTVSDSLVSCSIGDMVSGGSEIIRYQARALSAGLAALSVEVSAAEPDPDPSNNTASSQVDIVVPEPVDITLSSLVSSSQVDVGDLLDFHFIVENKGTVPAYLTHLEFVLPPQVEFESSSDCSNSGSVVICAVGMLVGGTSSGVSVTVLAIASDNSVILSGRVSHIESDPEPDNNASSVSIIINDPPPDSADLQSDIMSSSAQFVVGESLDFSFRVVNLGPSDASQVQLVIDLPAELEFVSASDCALAGESVVCDIGQLLVDVVYTGSLSIRSSVSSVAVTISANVVGYEVDANLFNNVASVTLPSLNPVDPTKTMTPTPMSTLTPVIVTATSGLTQTPFTRIITQPVFLTEAPRSDESPDVSGAGSGIDLLSDGVVPSEIYGWTRYESVDLIPVTGRWVLRTSQNASDGAYHESRDSGAMLRYPFVGDGFRIGYRSDVHGGSFQVLLDGAFLALYSSDYTQIDADLDPVRQTFRTQPHWDTPGYHVVDLVCLSDGKGAQGCNIDYIEVFSGPPIPIVPTAVAISTQAIVITEIELIAAPPTPAPTELPPQESVITVDVFVNMDLNTNGQIEPNEGVSGMTVQAVDVSNNTTLISGLTDESGFLRLRVVVGSDIVLLIPMLGESFYVRNRGRDLTEIWALVIDPATIPGLIP
jgi:uncharacterized repeat protein (TIGR01451 family)